MQGFVVDRVYLQAVKEDTQDIVGRVPHLGGTDPADGTVLHPGAHGRTELLIDSVEDRILQLGGKTLKSILVGSIALQQGGCTVPDPRLIHQGGSETGAECLSDMPGFDHPDPSNAFQINMK